eukprot:gene24482-27689_t
MNQEEQIKKHSGALERAAWFLVIFGMLSEISTDYAFPSYNIALGFWGAYSVFSKHGRATFAFISFTFLGIILDIVFCANNHNGASMFKFCLTMFIFCLFIKVYALYQASLFFTSIGGAYSLDSSTMTTSMYDSFRHSHHSVEGEQQEGYYPPGESQMQHQQSSGLMGQSSGSFLAPQEHNNSSMVDSATF